jgi:3-phosphoshikimate 1-carboxyvinyltransferase
MGAKIEILNSRIESGEPIADLVVHQSQLRGINLEGPIIANIIDELPIISIAAAFAIGNTTIRDAVELRIKESDRLKAISDGFKILGVKHDNFDDGMKIYGNSELKSNSDPIIINSQHDHRIAMSFLIAALKSSQPIQVNQCKNIFTSFPNFIELTSSLGFKIEK